MLKVGGCWTVDELAKLNTKMGMNNFFSLKVDFKHISNSFLLKPTSRGPVRAATFGTSGFTCSSGTVAWTK